MRAPLVALALLAAVPAATAQELESQLERALQLVSSAVEQSFARTLPLPAPSTGVSYSFDPASGNFRRDPATLGQVYLQRADPIGAGRWNLSFVYQYAGLDELGGHDAGSLPSEAPIPLDGLAAAIDFSTFGLGVDVHQFLFAASYGISDDLEVSVAVPIVYSDISIDLLLSAAAETPGGEVVTISEPIREHQKSTGIGDVFLRAKYRLLALDDVRVAAALQLRLPSGNQTALHGLGYVEMTPLAIVSTRIFEPAPWARLQGHFNGGVEIDVEDAGNSTAAWGFGLDWGVSDGVTAAIAFLAQNDFSGVAPPGAFTFPACSGDLVTCATDPSARGGTQQLFGLTGERVDTYSFSIGGRASVWRDTLFAMVNVAIPLNDAFVRTTPIPLIGLEATF